MQKNTTTEVKLKPCWISQLQYELQRSTNICIQNLRECRLLTAWKPIANVDVTWWDDRLLPDFFVCLAVNLEGIANNPTNP